MMRKRWFLTGALAVVCALTALAAACGEDGNPAAERTPLPAPGGEPGRSARGGGIEAARRYLHDTGIDARTGSLSDPPFCEAPEPRTRGDYCIHERASIFAPGLVVLVIGDIENPYEIAWEMRLEPQEGIWTVTSVKQYGAADAD
jgi:hypothetical protein